MSTDKNKYSWILLILTIWYLIGSIAYPSWWYKFIFEFGFIHIGYYYDGIYYIIVYLSHNGFNFFLFSLFIIAFIFVPKLRSLIKIPALDFFTKKTFWYIPLALFVTSLFLYTNKSDKNKNNKDIQEATQYTQKQHRETEYELFVKNLKYIDPIYINNQKIETLYSQIADTTRLESKTFEHEKEKTAGGDINFAKTVSINAKASGHEKQASTYKNTPDSYAHKLLKYLKDTEQLKSIQLFDRLEFNSIDLVELDYFEKTSKKFNIKYDEKAYIQAKAEATKRDFLSQKTNLTRSSSLILLKGDHILSSKNGHISLQKEYFSDHNFNITFRYTYAPEDSLSKIISKDSNETTILLASLSRIIKSTEEKNGSITILCEPYAIFWVQ